MSSKTDLKVLNDNFNRILVSYIHEGTIAGHNKKNSSIAQWFSKCSPRTRASASLGLMLQM